MEKMTLPQAAAKLDISQQLLRLWIQNGTCPFGLIVNEGVRKTYLINSAALNKYINGEIK